MNIQPIKTDSVPAPSKPKTSPAKAVPQPQTDAPATERNEKFMKALRNAPDVRPEELARGQALAADPNYPSDEKLSKLAELFVDDARRSK